MDWTFPIERWRLPLLGRIAKLCADMGLTEGGTVERISKPLHRFILRRLRSAESAARRLIIAAASDIIVVPGEPRPPRPRRKPHAKPKATADGEAPPRRKRRLLFSLFDALKRYGRRFKKKKRRGPEPRIRFFPPDPPDTRHPMLRGLRQPEPPPPPPPPEPVVEVKAPVDDNTVSARSLVRRLIAVMDALQDIERHARRYAIWRAKAYEDRHPQRRSALRVGRPPGFRQRPIDEVDEILKECHWLALKAEHPLDTS